jgi:type I restriction enzyme S subunit
LPPFPEQRRIVAKLDSLCSRTKAARDELVRIPLLIEHYKQAILEKAFSGELTADWRAREKLRGVPQPENELPEGWSIKQLQHIAHIQGGLALGKKRVSDEELFEVQYLRVANVQRGYLDLSEIKTLWATHAEIEKLSLIRGDILMNEGGDRDKLGRGWVWDGEITSCIHQNHVFRVRLFDPNIPPRYISYFANEFGQKYFFDEGKQTTNLASVSKSKVSALPVPVPPPAEALEIVRLIEEAMAWLNLVATEQGKATCLLNHLDQGLLAKAFRGELVLQDPKDEPAEKLLERIRAARSTEAKSRRGRRCRAAA